MALMKGWKEHTWWRVKQLENDLSGLWKGIQAEFFENWFGSILARIDSSDAALRMIGVLK